MAGRRAGLFQKYFAFIVLLVSGGLVASGAIGLYFSYQETRNSLVSLQREKALTRLRAHRAVPARHREPARLDRAAHVAPPMDAMESRRLDFLKLLRQAPAVTEITHLDGQGREQLMVSRLAMDRVGAIDATAPQEPRFVEARTGQDLVRAGVLPQGDRALHGDRDPRGARPPGRDGRRREPQVHLGRGLAHPHRAEGHRLRGRRQGLPRRPPRHQPGAAQGEPLGAAAGEGGARRRRRTPIGARCPRRAISSGEPVLSAYARRRARPTGGCSSRSRAPRSSRPSTTPSCAPSSCSSRAW